jgi:hypothetical protein
MASANHVQNFSFEEQTINLLATGWIEKEKVNSSKRKLANYFAMFCSKFWTRLPWKMCSEWAHRDRIKSQENISRYISQFFKPDKEEMKVEKEKIPRICCFSFHFFKCKAQMKFILLMNFLFPLKDFLRKRWVIKYKFESARSGMCAWIMRKKSGKSTNRLFFIINSYRWRGNAGVKAEVD